MKSLLTVIVGTLLALASLFPVFLGLAVAAGPAWVLADENADTRFYYDSQGITSPDKGISRVAVRAVYTEEGKADALELLGHAPAYEKLFESGYRYDIDCEKKKSHLLHVTHLDDAGNPIKSTDLAGVTEWEDIPPYSRLELLAEEVCKSEHAGK
jgi:hypothetical protein